jgi:hypothetical protein
MLDSLNFFSRSLVAAAAITSLSPVAALAAEILPAGQSLFYVGVDERPTLTRGAYSGLANPNLGRLTLLYNHGNHYHGIGSYSLSGPVESPVVTDTSTNNRIPETFSLQPPIPFTPGSGLYAGRHVNTFSPDVTYSQIKLAATDALGQLTDPESQVLFASSGGGWDGSLAGSNVVLNLLSRTPGLTIGDDSTIDLFASSNTFELGAGDLIDFRPIFSVAATAALGTYSAEFFLSDSNGLFLDSGRFFFDFAQVTAVPVPAAGWLLMASLGALPTFARRRS